MKLPGLALALLTSAAHGAPIEVFPGPGTPIQDAIDGAAERAAIRLHTGTYNEAPIVNKAKLKLAVAGDGAVVIDAGCAAPTTLDIAADGVSIKGRDFFTSPLFVRGGTAEQMRIDQRTRVRISGVFTNMYTSAWPGLPCTTGNGMTVAGSTRVRIDLDPGNIVGIDVGLHIKGTLPGAKITIAGSRGATTGNDVAGNGASGVAVLLEDVASDLGEYGGARVRLHRLGAQGRGGGIRFVNSDGVVVDGNIVVGGTSGGAAAPGLELDGTSDNNKIDRNYLLARAGGPAVVDNGTGNCGTGNSFDPSGTLPACP